MSSGPSFFTSPTEMAQFVAAVLGAVWLVFQIVLRVRDEIHRSKPPSGGSDSIDYE